MKALIEQYLSDQGIKPEPFKVQFLRYTEKLYTDDEGNCCLEFPKWSFPCPKPTFTSQEIKDCYKEELIESIIDGINNKLTGDAATDKIDELNTLTKLEDIKNFTY